MNCIYAWKFRFFIINNDKIKIKYKNFTFSKIIYYLWFFIFVLMAVTISAWEFMSQFENDS